MMRFRCSLCAFVVPCVASHRTSHYIFETLLYREAVLNAGSRLNVALPTELRDSMFTLPKHS
jgi:hypothetical protein